MRANLIALSILLAVTCAAFLRAEPAYCQSCASLVKCFNSAGCAQGCRCFQPDGIGKPGFCG